MVFKKEKLGYFGLGLGLRKDLRSLTLNFFNSETNIVNQQNNITDKKRLIEWLEMVPENYIAKGGRPRQNFEEVLATGVQLIPHGINLSIGTAPAPGEQGPCYDRYLIDAFKELFVKINPPWFSDHLSCTRIEGCYLQDLIPVPFTFETVRVITDNIKFLQDEFQLPFLVENPSYYSTLIEEDEPEMPEAEFINEILEKADCGMLLDVNNVYVNSVNHDYDAMKFLDEINLDRVVQVHIAGHKKNFRAQLSGKLLKILDTHGEPIIEAVYGLLDALLKKTRVNAVLLERDSNFPENFEDLIAELKRIRSIMDKKLVFT